jgi:hypothetical protein
MLYKLQSVRRGPLVEPLESHELLLPLEIGLAIDVVKIKPRRLIFCFVKFLLIAKCMLFVSSSIY